jgi:hypothetical protein
MPAGPLGSVEIDGFMRWMEVPEREWVDLSERAAPTEERASSAQLSLLLPFPIEARLGYQHERQRLWVEDGAEADYQEPLRDITVLSVTYLRDRLEVYFDQQWIWEQDARSTYQNGRATIMSIGAIARF